MPIYEFYCSKCAKEFELTRPFSDSDKPGTCPDCGCECQKMVSVCSTNTDYRIKYPVKGAFRGAEVGELKPKSVEKKAEAVRKESQGSKRKKNSGS